MKRERYFIRYFYKWLILIFSIFALVSITFNLISYLRERQYYFRIIEQEQQERISYLSRNMNNEFVKLKIMANMTLKDEEVTELYCKYDFVNSYERNKLMENIRERCLEMDNLNSFVYASTFYLPEKGLKIDREGFEIIGEDAYDFAQDNPDQEMITMKDGKAYIVELSRKNYLKGWERENILGIFVIELNMEQIQNEMLLAKMTDEDIIFMTGRQENGILFQTGEIDLESLKAQEGAKTVEMNGEKYLLMHSTEKGSYFNLYYLQDQTFLKLMTEKTVTSVMLFIGVILLTIIVAIILFYRRIYRPLEILLVDAFAQIKKSNFSYRIPLPEKGSAFTNLYQNFNCMAERIDTLVSRELKQEILVNQANFKHLQAQINPHFMYNSYFLLYRLIKKGDKEGSLQVCENLGKFFKYINRDSGENKSLADEVSHARSYAVIQGFRYQNIIHVDFPELPEKYGYIEVPRLIIQPLIENVFKYVVDELDEDEEVILRVKYEEIEEDLLICVENSGNMEEEKLEEISRKLEYQKENEDITALMNISYRLNVFFNRQESLTVCRSQLGGLMVCLRLKM
ncbi:MAG: histidine kinase [Eubacteriales bacterium]|nr:histidine kinase [Eubacteriales bacterium]